MDILLGYLLGSLVTTGIVCIALGPRLRSRYFRIAILWIWSTFYPIGYILVRGAADQWLRDRGIYDYYAPAIAVPITSLATAVVFGYVARSFLMVWIVVFAGVMAGLLAMAAAMLDFDSLMYGWMLWTTIVGLGAFKISLRRCTKEEPTAYESHDPR